MIKNIYTADRYLQANMTSDSYYISFPADSEPAFVGAIRYHYGNLETFDGGRWLAIQTHTAHIDLPPDIKAVIDWAANKMNEEKKLNQLCKDNPALAKARDNYEVIKKLVASEC